MDEVIGVYSEKLISIILNRGDGTKENPVRLVKQYRILNSNTLLFEIDPYVNQDWSNCVAASTESSESINVTTALIKAFNSFVE